MPGQRRRTILAAWIVTNAACGDAVRNVIGYPAWAGVVLATFIWVAVELVLLRVRLWRMPVSVVAFATMALVSAIWAIAPGWSLVGSVILFGTIASAVLIASLPYRVILDVTHWTMQGLLIASFVFEAFVALVLRHPLFPLWADYPPDASAEFHWSSGLIFEGGRVQGIMGNANLLGMVALIALVLAGCRAAAGLDRWWPVWVALPLLAHIVTRSATVLFATAMVAVLTFLVVSWVRWRGATFYRIFGIAIAVGLVCVGVIVANWAFVTDFLGRDADMTGRFDIWGRVIDLGLTSPVVGVGYLGYWMPWVPPFDQLGEMHGTVYLQAHNVWLDVFMQLGIVGLLLWGGLQYRAARNCLGALYRSPVGERALNAIPLLLWVALFMQGLAESRPWIEFGMMLLVIFVIGPLRKQIAPRAPRTVAITTVG
ncbi:O-antigen ligase [Agrococcus baldri]|uniref:O-antigen ligase n=1 Tax=Agrococcus baldri TaxID=153730 RepID=A0AA94L007_9MICO|nr:O-antigen ligase family protein [Agrococcus baldri]SFS14105.1 O-antigen ligase [Agrococcus baldri]